MTPNQLQLPPPTDDVWSLIRQQLGSQAPEDIDVSPLAGGQPDVMGAMGFRPGYANQGAMEADADNINRASLLQVGTDGSAMDRAAAGAYRQGSAPDDGLPGTRLVQYYTAWVSTKLGENQEMLNADRYYHGKQWSQKELEILTRRGQPPTYFNELRKKVDSYIGIEQRLRRDPKGYPKTPQHEGDADAATAGLRTIHDQNRGPVLYSEAGRDYFVRGIGCVWQGVQPDVLGKTPRVVMRRVPGMGFFYDPRSLEWDFADAKFIGEWGWYDVEDAADLMLKLGRDDSAAMMQSLAGIGDPTSAGGVPGEWSRMKADWWSRELARVRLVHMYYRWRGMWRCAYFCGAIKLYDQPSIYLDEDGQTVHPFNAASCNVDEEGVRYGVVKDLIPIQDSINARHSRLLWMMSVRQIITEKGAVDDINHAREQARRPDGVIMLNPKGKDGMERRFKIETMDAQIEGQAKLLEISQQQMANYGPNTALLGKGEGIDQASGRALLARQNAGMTEMSSVFDRHREFKLTSFRKNWLLIKQFWTQEMWFRVTDDQKGFKFVALNQFTAQGVVNDVGRMDIDITIEEGPDTVTMNEELMQQLTQLGPTALTPLGKIIITLSGVRNKDYLFSLIDEATAPPPVPPEVAKAQAMMQKLDLILKGAAVDAKIADSESKRAGAMKTLVDAMATPAMLAEFPMRFGGQTFAEQAVEDVLNPHAMLENAFKDGPAPSPGGPVPPGGLPPPPSAGIQPPHAARGGGPFQFGAGPPDGPMQMPGQEPKMGALGGLPLPGVGTPNGLEPPANTRAN